MYVLDEAEYIFAKKGLDWGIILRAIANKRKKGDTLGIQQMFCMKYYFLYHVLHDKVLKI